MRILLVQILLLQFFKPFHKYLPYANFGLFIPLVRFFGQSLLSPIALNNLIPTVRWEHYLLQCSFLGRDGTQCRALYLCSARSTPRYTLGQKSLSTCFLLCWTTLQMITDKLMSKGVISTQRCIKKLNIVECAINK